MNWQGGSGQWGSNSWSIAGRAPSWTDNALLGAALGQNAVTVTGFQHANHTTVNGGRLHVADDSSLASEVVVNAGGAISGDGWVASNLTLRGDLAASGAQPLKVLGRADVAGGELTLLDGYTQPPGTSREFVVLEAFGGVQGSLSTAINAPLGAGLFLEHIDSTTDPTKILVRIRSADADYNNNGRVDAADYVVWRKRLGAAVEPGSGADANRSGIIDAGDYDIWRSQFGAMVTSGAVSSATTTPIPEPRTIYLILATFFILPFSGRALSSTRAQ
jgi:hypothetical protein